MIYWITCCHMPTRVMNSSREALRSSVYSEEWSAIDQTVFVDHRYPLQENAAYLKEWALSRKADLICPPKNLGGHGGVSYALRFLRPQNDDDIVFVIDPDSFPLTRGWFTACLDALKVDPTLGGVSLTDTRLTERPWSIEPNPFGPRVGFLPGAEMWNMSAFRFRVLREGFLADSQFYGFVETAMWKHMKKMGLRHGYLIDYLEQVNPVPHDAPYTEWKREHAAGRFKGNFEEFVNA